MNSEHIDIQIGFKLKSLFWWRIQNRCISNKYLFYGEKNTSFQLSFGLVEPNK